MELRGIEVIFMHRCTEWLYVVAVSNRVGVAVHVVTVDEVHKVTLANAIVERTLEIMQAVPSHVRDFLAVLSRDETFHLSVEDSQAVSVALLAVAAHQLHSDADAQHRLCQTCYHFVKAA